MYSRKNIDAWRTDDSSSIKGSACRWCMKASRDVSSLVRSLLVSARVKPLWFLHVQITTSHPLASPKTQPKSQIRARDERKDILSASWPGPGAHILLLRFDAIVLWEYPRTFMDGSEMDLHSCHCWTSRSRVQLSAHPSTVLVYC